MAKKKKSKANKRASRQHSAQYGTSTGGQIVKRSTSRQPIQSRTKQEPQLIDFSRSSKPTHSQSPGAQNSNHSSRTATEGEVHAADVFRSSENRLSPRRSSSGPNIVQTTDKTPAHPPETTRLSKKRRRSNEIVPNNDDRTEPEEEYLLTSGATSEELLRSQASIPDERTLLCETTVEKKGTMHVIVTTKEQYQTAVRCPCERDCGRYVRVGEYAKYAVVGTPFCPHCRSNLGSEYGFNSYPQLVAHINTKTCRSIQKVQSQKGVPKELRMPKRLTSRKALGPEVFKRINQPAYKVSKDGSTYFKCFRCSMEVPHATRFRHCMGCLLP